MSLYQLNYFVNSVNISLIIILFYSKYQFNFFALYCEYWFNFIILHYTLNISQTISYIIKVTHLTSRNFFKNSNNPKITYVPLKDGGSIKDILIIVTIASFC